jgi:hypothetical protein
MRTVKLYTISAVAVTMAILVYLNLRPTRAEGVPSDIFPDSKLWGLVDSYGWPLEVLRIERVFGVILSEEKILLWPNLCANIIIATVLLGLIGAIVWIVCSRIYASKR